MSDRIAIVGCGQQKLDLDEPTVPIARLYTSNYFELKRKYAKTCCDRYYILSAKHGLADPGMYVASYDLTIDDLDDDEHEAWVWDVGEDLDMTVRPGDTIVWLTGSKYFEPFDDDLTALAERVTVEYPFGQTSGIGEQMAWLKEEIESAEQAAQTGDAAQQPLDAFSGGDA